TTITPYFPLSISSSTRQQPFIHPQKSHSMTPAPLEFVRHPENDTTDPAQQTTDTQTPPQKPDTENNTTDIDRHIILNTPRKSVWDTPLTP
ncbi:hypothetical protein, partial [uncultured Duncaniella sp.]